MLVKSFDIKYLGDFNKEEFSSKYKSASGILFKKIYENKEKEEYLNEFYLKLLLDTYNNEQDMLFIKKSNDYLNISPVYTWLKINEDKLREYYKKNKNEKKIDDESNSQLRVAIGAFWGYVMMYDKKNNNSIRFKKSYEKSKKKHNINRKEDNDNYAWGFKTAALYI